MSEKPILFSGPMVRAIREGRKTQTRRIVRVCCERAAHPLMGTWGVDFTACECGAVKMPYATGDVLWVKEAWKTAASLDKLSPKKIMALCTEAGYRKPWTPIQYMADGETDNTDTLRDFGGEWGRYRHARFIPREFARTFLTVTRVRIAQVQDISEADAIAEGIRHENVIVGANCCGGIHVEEDADRYWNGTEDDDFEGHKYAYSAFVALWTSIHGPGAWERNDWVWVYDFERTQP